MTTWNKITSCCTWLGIMCDRVTGHMIGLDLSCSRLQGIISSNSNLFLLHHLQVLDLSLNDFRGSPILPEFGQFKNMTHLNLRYSNFSGHVPLEISHLSKLISLRLGGDKIMIGAFKALAQILTCLTHFYLSGIDLSFLPPVCSLKNFSSLTFLHLHDCKLGRKHVDDIVQLPKLQQRYLFDNEAPNGSFPRFNRSSPLWTLNLNGSKRFSIDLSLLLKNMPRPLSYLPLSGSNLAGSYPAVLGNLTKIVSLDLSDNNLSGKIPQSSFKLNKKIP